MRKFKTVKAKLYLNFIREGGGGSLVKKTVPIGSVNRTLFHGLQKEIFPLAPTPPFQGGLHMASEVVNRRVTLISNLTSKFYLLPRNSSLKLLYEGERGMA